MFSLMNYMYFKQTCHCTEFGMLVDMMLLTQPQTSSSGSCTLSLSHFMVRTLCIYIIISFYNWYVRKASVSS